MCRTEEGDLVVRGANVLLAEIVKQADDVVAAGEVKDLAEALALLAPLVRSPRLPSEAA